MFAFNQNIVKIERQQKKKNKHKKCDLEVQDK